MRRIFLILALILCAQAAWAERRVALVLGTAQYTALRPLANPLNDAVAIEARLRDLGFDVFLETNRDLRRTRRALDDFAADAAGADLALVFYAGHGLEVDGQNLLLPTDSDPATLDSLKNTALPLAEVTATLSRIAPKAVLLIDACRSDPFAPARGRSAEALTGEVQLRPGLGRIGRADGLIYAFAAAPGEPALDGTGDNSPFTEALIRHIATEGLELRSVLTLVQQDVYDRTRGAQLPYVESGLPGLVFAGGRTDLPERELLLLAMAEIDAEDRLAIERTAAVYDMPLAPLFGALLQANLSEGSRNARDAQLAEAAAAYAKVQTEIKTLSAADPAVTALREEAEEALALGAFDTARALLANAADIDRNSRGTLRENLVERTVSEAETLMLSATAAAAELRRDLAIADLTRAVALYDEALALEPGSVVRQSHILALEELRQLHETLGDLPSVQSVAFENHRLIAARAASDPEFLRWQRDLAVSFEKLGDLARGVGNLAEARTQYETALAIRERLIASDPEERDFQRDLAVSHNGLGELAQLQGDLVAARRHYALDLEISQRLVNSDPSNLGWQRDLSVTHNKIGQLARREGDLAAARENFEAALAIRERLVAARPENREWQRDLSVSYNLLGDLASNEGDLDLAQQYFEADLAIAERLAALDPGNSTWQRDVAVSHNKLGQLARNIDDYAAARAHYQAGLVVSERLAAMDPTNSLWQRDLSISHIRLGDLADDEGDPATARTQFLKSLEIRERLAASDPTNREWQRDLAVNYNRIGDIDRNQSDFAAARRNYEAAQGVVERLAASDPTNLQWQRDLVVSYEKMGDVSKGEGKRDDAQAFYAAALAISEHLTQVDPGNANWAWTLMVGHYKLSTAADDPLPHLEAAVAVGDALAAQVRLPQGDVATIEYLRDQMMELRADRLQTPEQPKKSSQKKGVRKG